MSQLLTDIPNYDQELERLANRGGSIDLSRQFNELLRDMFNVQISDGFVEVLKIIAVVVILAVLFWFVYKELILPKYLYATTGEGTIVVPKGGIQGTAADADIRGHNFEKELSKAINAGNYAEAVRLRYLFTLQQLNKYGAIAWKEWKTPLMYVEEMQQDAELLQSVTTTFLYIKYGHYPADSDTFKRVAETSDTLIQNAKGGAE